MVLTAASVDSRIKDLFVAGGQLDFPALPLDLPLDVGARQGPGSPSPSARHPRDAQRGSAYSWIVDATQADEILVRDTKPLATMVRDLVSLPSSS